MELIGSTTGRLTKRGADSLVLITSGVLLEQPPDVQAVSTYE